MNSFFFMQFSSDITNSHVLILVSLDWKSSFVRENSLWYVVIVLFLAPKFLNLLFPLSLRRNLIDAASQDKKS